MIKGVIKKLKLNPGIRSTNHHKFVIKHNYKNSHNFIIPHNFIIKPNPNFYKLT